MKENYYRIDLNHNTQIILKCPQSTRELFEILHKSRGIIGSGGTVYNLSNYVSFHEITYPTEYHKTRAITIDRIIE